MERGQKRFVSALGRMCFLEHRVSSVVETLQAAGLHPSDYLLNPDAGVKWFFSTRSINSVTAVGLMTSDLNRDVLWCWVKRHISSVSGCQILSLIYFNIIRFLSAVIRRRWRPPAGSSSRAKLLETCFKEYNNIFMQPVQFKSTKKGNI